jgi:dTDP-4-amino-4,6-dideoxygalactose transaminase
MLCDTAQGFGATLDGRRTGGIGDAAATSFFPAKPLGCYGDGGASFTNDDGLIELLRSIRIHGQGVGQIRERAHRREFAPRHDPGRDPDRENENLSRGNRTARASRSAIRRRSAVPTAFACRMSSTARNRPGRNTRSRCPIATAAAADLKAKGIPTAIYYPIPLNAQKGYSHFPARPCRSASGCKDGDQPADASLSRRSNAGPHRRSVCWKASEGGAAH